MGIKPQAQLTICKLLLIESMKCEGLILLFEVGINEPDP